MEFKDVAAKMRPVTDVVWSVCLLGTAVSPTKTDEPIEMPFWLWIQVGQGNHELGGGPDTRGGRGNFGRCSPIEMH